MLLSNGGSSQLKQEQGNRVITTQMSRSLIEEYKRSKQIMRQKSIALKQGGQKKRISPNRKQVRAVIDTGRNTKPKN